MQPSEFDGIAPGEVVKAVQGHWTFVPNPLPPTIGYDTLLVRLIGEAERSLGELAGVALTLPNPQLLIRPFMSREAVLSSQIEGTVTKLNQLLLFEIDPNSERDPEDAGEVLNYVRAADFGVNAINSGYPISLSMIEEMHRILLDGVRGHEKRPGQLRDRAVFLGRDGQSIEFARFVPPCRTRIRLLLDDLIDFIRNERDMPIVVQLAVTHYQFETIHPFNDGNGRIGRLLIMLLLCERKVLPLPMLYLSAYFERDRQEYYDGLLNVSRRGSWEKWIAYVARGVAEQSQDSTLRARRLLELRQSFRNRAIPVARSPAAYQIVDELFGSPFITVQRACQIAKVTRAAAQTTIEKLVDAGLLREITGKKRNRIYCADEIMSVLDSAVTS